MQDNDIRVSLEQPALQSLIITPSLRGAAAHTVQQGRERRRRDLQSFTAQIRETRKALKHDFKAEGARKK
ncbi:hypothetical protein NDU88_006930 [Pleurodeles waltl]|uniref:Uncharacterized protein n=1 Tax=Pleurodeles waltl TaxID=8319 RepID=A0AAV7PMT9_PLEWA|nr:hypothetical protein NDU88_006930 [Pleurodeles waltl]